MTRSAGFPAFGDEETGSSPGQTSALLAEVRRLAGSACAACDRPLCGHEAVLSIVLGYRSSARCRACVASAMREEPAALFARVAQYLQRRDCYREGWSWASAEEGIEDLPLPACLAVAGDEALPGDGARGGGGANTGGANTGGDVPHADAELDAGDMGCGDLVLKLRIRLRGMAAGEVLHLTARDPGAPADMPAWCGMTGHTLLLSQPPEYWIRRKSD